MIAAAGRKPTWDYGRHGNDERRGVYSFLDTESMEITEIPLVSTDHVLKEMLVSWPRRAIGNFAVEIRDPPKFLECQRKERRRKRSPSSGYTFRKQTLSLLLFLREHRGTNPSLENGKSANFTENPHLRGSLLGYLESGRTVHRSPQLFKRV